jgi:hypothetical protein
MREIGLGQVAEAVAAIGKRVAAQHDAAKHLTAQVEVLICAVGALVQTHPDPEAFAAAFRGCWQTSGLADKKFPDGSTAQSGLSEALSMLEVLCPVRLSVRPPDQAEPPVQEQD